MHGRRHKRAARKAVRWARYTTCGNNDSEGIYMPFDSGIAYGMPTSKALDRFHTFLYWSAATIALV